uniref:Uncharacterized protein n=1 Tax=Arundo donax TaxID=35708 RepID=A0A0A9C2D4_ARUDO
MNSCAYRNEMWCWINLSHSSNQRSG